MRYRTRAALVVVQVALSLVLLIGAGLLVRAFVAVQQVDAGFRADDRLTFRVALSGNRYPDTERLLNAATTLRQRLAAIRGVTAVGAISNLPYDDLPNWGVTYALNPTQAQGGVPRATTRAISAGLFETLGVQRLEGRMFGRPSPLSIRVSRSTTYGFSTRTSRTPVRSAGSRCGLRPRSPSAPSC